MRITVHNNQSQFLTFGDSAAVVLSEWMAVMEWAGESHARIQMPGGPDGSYDGVLPDALHGGDCAGR